MLAVTSRESQYFATGRTLYNLMSTLINTLTNTLMFTLKNTLTNTLMLTLKTREQDTKYLKTCSHTLKLEIMNSCQGIPSAPLTGDAKSASKKVPGTFIKSELPPPPHRKFPQIFFRVAGEKMKIITSGSGLKTCSRQKSLAGSNQPSP